MCGVLRGRGGHAQSDSSAGGYTWLGGGRRRCRRRPRNRRGLAVCGEMTFLIVFPHPVSATSMCGWS